MPKRKQTRNWTIFRVRGAIALMRGIIWEHQFPEARDAKLALEKVLQRLKS